MLASLLEVAMLNKCTPLWREAHSEVKMHKTHHALMMLKKHAVVARSTFPSQRKCTPLWRKAHVQVKMLKTRHARITSESSNVVSRSRRKGFCILPNVSKMWGFCSISKNNDKQWQAWDIWRGSGMIWKHAFHVAGAVQETCLYADFLRGVAFWKFRFAKVILRNRCRTSYQMASLLRGGRHGTLHRWSGEIEEEVSQNCLVFDVVNLSTSKIEGRLAELLRFHVANFEIWGRYAELLQLPTSKIEDVSQNCFVLMLPTSKNEDVSQNCFAFHVANFEKWGRLAELLRFWCCQLWKWRKSRRIASFSRLRI